MAPPHGGLTGGGLPLLMGWFPNSCFWLDFSTEILLLSRVKKNMRFVCFALCVFTVLIIIIIIIFWSEAFFCALKKQKNCVVRSLRFVFGVVFLWRLFLSVFARAFVFLCVFLCALHVLKACLCRVLLWLFMLGCLCVFGCFDRLFCLVLCVVLCVVLFVVLCCCVWCRVWCCVWCCVVLCVCVCVSVFCVFWRASF